MVDSRCPSGYAEDMDAAYAALLSEVDAAPRSLVRADLYARLGVSAAGFRRICGAPTAHNCDADHLSRWREVVAEWRATARRRGRPRLDVDEAAHMRAEMAR